MKVKPDLRGRIALTRATGRVVAHDTKRGVHLQAWPKKRGFKGTPYEKYSLSEFAIVAAWHRDVEPVNYHTAIMMARGTQYTPRDILTMAAYGTIGEFKLPTGEIWRSYRLTIPNVQLILEQITSVVGSIIYRDPDGWVLLEPGDPGQFLGIANGEPTWMDQPDSSPPPVQNNQRVMGLSTGAPADQVELSVSTVLDWLTGAAQGAIAYRGATGWTCLAPGSANQVLVTQGVGANPAWSEASGVAGVPQWMDIPISYAGDASAFATRGNYFTPAIPLKLVHVAARGDTVSGKSYNLYVFQLNGNNLQTKLLGPLTFTATVTRAAGYHWTVSPALDLAAGTEYWICVNRPDTAGNVSNGLGITSSQTAHIPMVGGFMSRAWTTQQPPAAGGTLSGKNTFTDTSKSCLALYFTT